MKKRKKLRSLKGNIRNMLIVFVCVCVAVGVMSFQFYNQLQSTIRSESQGYLAEVARRVGSNIDRIISGNFSVLDSLSAYMRASGVETFEQIKAVVKNQEDSWDFRDVILIDDRGKAYNSSGSAVSLNNDTYFADTVLEKKQGISATQMIDSQERIMLAIPLTDLIIDGKNMVTLASSYDPSTFDRVLSMTAFSGQAYACIISKSGEMVIRSSAETSLKTGYNVLTTIGEALGPNYEIDSIRADIISNREGQAEFTQAGQRHYVVYTPIAPGDWYLLTFVPSWVVNEKSDMLLQVTLVMCGIITLIFAALIVLLLYSFYRNKQRLENLAYVDAVTDGNTIQRFYELTQQALEVSGHPPYALVFTNLEKFKVMNEEFGRPTCDSMLRTMNLVISRSLKGKECAGRLSADNFCVLLDCPDEAALVERFRGWHDHLTRFIAASKPVWSMPVAEFGVFLIDNDTIPFPQMIDRAKLSLRENARSINGRLRYAIYNDEVRRRLFREKKLEDMMGDALVNGEFQVYLQPKYRVSDKKICGAEALTRWVSRSEGMIFPDEFIALFEKNGFITQLDTWVFEEVCRCVRRWINQGLTPLKISVNCSRVQVKNPDFIKEYRNIASKYQIPEGLLELELTESIVMEDAQRLIRVVDEIHAAGLTCSIDDFGSGYSSLNMIQSIRADTLKLDKIFFKGSIDESDRMVSVVESIVRMAMALSMTTVAEGVELPEQVKLLERVGCNQIQGYVFARPMPIPEFEALAFGEKALSDIG